MPDRKSKSVSSKISHAANSTKQLSLLSTQLDALTTASETTPIEHWNPEYCGDIDLVILASGDWIHEGRKMTRQSLVKLFARVLWRETDADGDHYFLKTPVEKIGIRVDDVPLVITQVDFIDDSQAPHPHIVCTTNTDDQFRLSATHPIFLRRYGDDVRPYTIVRRNIEAVFHRNAYFHLIERGDMQDFLTHTTLIIHSGHHRFELIG